MSNEIFIEQYKNNYPSLTFFTISNDRLILKIQATYTIPFTHVILAQVNPLLFTLNPIELFQALYILELFYKPELQPKDSTFITNYVNKYIELNNLV